MRPRRAIRTVLVFVLLGAVATVLTSWAIQALAYARSGSNTKIGFDRWPAAVTPFSDAQWAAYASERVWHDSIQSERITVLSTGIRSGRGWRVQLESVMVAQDGGDAPNVTIRYLDLVDTGWPAKGMRHASFRETERPGDPSAVPGRTSPVSWRGGIEIERRGQPQYRGFDRLALPVTPLWPGFALNTVFNAMLLAILAGFASVLVRLVRLFRRALRRHRGRCPACGYDRAGLDAGSPCPECGRAVAAT